MAEWQGSQPPRPIFFGLALVTVGALFLLRELGAVPDISVWTIIWLALGTWLLLGTLARNRRGWFWPLALLLVGGFMLLRDLDVIDSGVAIWPLVVIAVGLSMVFEAASWGRSSKRKSPTPWDIDG